MSILDHAQAAFKNRPVREIEVPEWGSDEEALIIYVKPLTLQEQQKVFKLSQGNELEAMAQILIMKALDSEGNKLFTMKDKHTLMNSVDPSVVIALATDILGDGEGN